MSAAGQSAASHHAKGVILVLLAGLAWSSGGPLMRAIQDATPWQILFYRSAGSLAIVLGYLFWDERGNTWSLIRGLGRWGLLASCFIAGAFSLFIVAMRLTSVANTLFLLSASPLFAAGFGGLVLHEKVRRITWLAIAIATVGLAMMVFDGLSKGGFLGNLAGLCGALCFSSYTLILRHVESSKGKVDLRGTVALGSLIGMAVSGTVALVESGNLALGLSDTLYAIAFGVFQLGLGLIFYLLGAKYLTAAEATLLALSEVVLGSLWTWLLFGERSSGWGLIGGLVLLGAVILQSASGMKRWRPPVGMV